jgi:hypothetical protein
VGKSLIVVSSITYALKGKELLAQYGYKASVKKIRNFTKTGCGYGIYTGGDINRAIIILRSASIPVIEIRNDNR